MKYVRFKVITAETGTPEVLRDEKYSSFIFKSPSLKY